MSTQNSKSLLGTLRPDLFENTDLRDYQGEFIRPNIIKIYTSNKETDTVNIRKRMFLNAIKVMGRLGKIFLNPKIRPLEIVIVDQLASPETPILAIQTHWGGDCHGYIVGVWDAKWGGMYMEGIGRSFSPLIFLSESDKPMKLDLLYSANHQGGIPVNSLIYGSIPSDNNDLLKFAEAYTFYIAECARFDVLKYFFFKSEPQNGVARDTSSPILLFQGDLLFGGYLVRFTPSYLASHNRKLIELDYKVPSAALFDTIWQNAKGNEVKRYITMSDPKVKPLKPEEMAAFMATEFVFDVRKGKPFDVNNIPQVKEGFIYILDPVL